MKTKIEKHIVTIELRGNDIISSNYLQSIIQDALDGIGYRNITVKVEPESK